MRDLAARVRAWAEGHRVAAVVAAAILVILTAVVIVLTTLPSQPDGTQNTGSAPTAQATVTTGSGVASDDNSGVAGDGKTTDGILADPMAGLPDSSYHAAEQAAIVFAKMDAGGADNAGMARLIADKPTGPTRIAAQIMGRRDVVAATVTFTPTSSAPCDLRDVNGIQGVEVAVQGTWRAEITMRDRTTHAEGGTAVYTVTMPADGGNQALHVWDVADSDLTWSKL